MKKVLLATTVLALSATVAAADVTVSGDGRMGVTYNGGLATNKTAFSSRIRIAFAASGQTDSGLAFGGSIRADNAGAGAAGTAGNVFVSGAFGRLRMGDVDGAAEMATGDLAGVGFTGLGDFNEMTYLSNGSAGVRPTARYEYSTAGLTFAISHTNPGVASEVTAIGVAYSANGFSFGAGVEHQNRTAAVAGSTAVAGVATCGAGNLNFGLSATQGGLVCSSGAPTVVASVPAGLGVPAIGAKTHYTLSAAYKMDAITVKAAYGNLETKGVAGSLDQYGLSMIYAMDAASVTAFARKDFADDKHVGVGGSYNLGGGASVVGGIVNTNFNAAGVPSQTRADLGLTFSF